MCLLYIVTSQRTINVCILTAGKTEHAAFFLFFTEKVLKESNCQPKHLMNR